MPATAAAHAPTAGMLKWDEHRESQPPPAENGGHGRRTETLGYHLTTIPPPPPRTSNSPGRRPWLARRTERDVPRDLVGTRTNHAMAVPCHARVPSLLLSLYHCRPPSQAPPTPTLTPMPMPTTPAANTTHHLLTAPLVIYCVPSYWYPPTDTLDATPRHATQRAPEVTRAGMRNSATFEDYEMDQSLRVSEREARGEGAMVGAAGGGGWWHYNNNTNIKPNAAADMATHYHRRWAHTQTAGSTAPITWRRLE